MNVGRTEGIRDGMRDGWAAPEKLHVVTAGGKEYVRLDVEASGEWVVAGAV